MVEKDLWDKERRALLRGEVGFTLKMPRSRAIPKRLIHFKSFTVFE